MSRLLLAILTTIVFTQSAGACMGGATSIRHGQISAVNEAIYLDPSSNWQGIKKLEVVSDAKVVVTLSDYAGNSSIRNYETVPSKDSDLNSCDKFDAILSDRK